MLYILARAIWQVARLSLWVANVVLGFKPSLLEAIGMGSNVITWLLQPHILVPLTVATTLIAWGDVAYGLIKRSLSRRLARTPIDDMTLREAFDYLRFDSRWAMQFRSSDKCAVAAGREIEDKMRLERIPAWGCDMSFTFSSPQPINPVFWNGMNLNKGSLWTTAEDVASAETRAAQYPGAHGLMQFRDLKTDSVKVRETWPPAPMIVRPLLRMKMQNIGVDARSARRFQHRAKRRKQWRALAASIKGKVERAIAQVRAYIKR